MLDETIATERLALPLWTAADLEALQGRTARMSRWHADFPRQDDLDAASLWVAGDPWGPRSIVRGVTVLGSIGFFGPPAPADDGVPEAEVGYGLVAEARGWGFATEALVALVAAAEAGGVRVRASVEPGNKESLRVLAKAGFTTLRGTSDDGLLVMVRPLGVVPKRRSFEVRSTLESDWPRLRDFRLENTREDPISYGATVEAVLGFDEEAWRMRARRGEQTDAACFVATEVSTGRWVGMMQGQLGDEYGDSPVLTGVYVTAQFRGRRYGIADSLLGPVLAWARDHGTGLRLWVFEGSEPARRFYARHGFTETGRTRPLDLDPAAGSLIEMVLIF